MSMTATSRNLLWMYSSAAIIASLPCPVLAQTQTLQFDIRSQSLDSALRAFAHTARQQVLFDGRLVQGKSSSSLVGTYTPEKAIALLLADTGLTFSRTDRGVIFVEPSQPPTNAAIADVRLKDDTNKPAEIVVTAQKRTEKIQTVPIEVNVATAGQLQAAGVLNTENLGTVIPGLNISHATLLAFVPSIRGITTVSNTSENPTALYVDGVLIPGQQEGFRDLADVDQITVLKGPQGTLFGRNATAGVIQISTKTPSFTTQGAASVSYGSFNEIRASTYLTGAVTDKVAFSMTASYAHMGDGFGQRLASGASTNQLLHGISVRGKLLWQPSSDTDITLIADYSDRQDTGQAYQPLPGTTYSTRGVATPVASIPICKLPSRYDTCNGDKDYDIYRGGGVSGEIDHQFGFAKFVSITSYRKGYGEFELAGLPVAAQSLAPSLLIMHTEDVTQELQLISPSGGRLQWTAGAFFFHSDTNIPAFPTTVAYPSLAAPEPSNYTYANSIGDQKVNSVAAFAQADYKLTNTTTVTLGGRYTYEKHELIGGETIISFAGLGGYSVTLPGTSQKSITANVPTWRVALSQKVALWRMRRTTAASRVVAITSRRQAILRLSLKS
jgi:iron complex outermembrane recepter protein